MVALAQQVLAHSLNPSTRSSYASGINHIIAFHRGLGIQFAFPVSPDSLCLWMADSADKLRFPSMRVYMHAIATTQVELGYPSPLHASPLVWRMFRAIKRLQGQSVARTRLPITVSVLRKLDPLINEADTLHCCMRAAMWLGTTGLLRSGEFTRKPRGNPPPQLQHLTFHNEAGSTLDPLRLNGERPHYMQLRLSASKTDPFRAGTTVTISHPRAMLYMLVYLRRRDLALSRMPLFAGADGQPLAAAALVPFTQALIARANIPNAHMFLGHSFRKGGATSLHEAGNPDSLIKAMGRWSSFTFARYIDTPLTMLIAAGHSMQKVELPSTCVLPSSFWENMD